ncbi:MAG TPA: M60 family metallopeptidase [Schlesneria sp.]|jgi:hypothetical protein
MLIRWLVALVICAAIPQQAFPATTDLPAELREGVSQIKLPGLVGALSVYGPDAFTIAAAPLEDGEFAAVVAVGSSGKGRIVCAGHPGYLSVDVMKEAETGRLMNNLLLWVGHVQPKQTKPLRLVLLDNKPLAEALAKNGYRTQSVAAAQLGESLGSCDVLLARPSKIQKRDVSKIVDFLKRGGGLIMADAAWIWSGYDAQPGENLVRDFAGNQLARPFGISWAAATVKGQDGLIAVADGGGLLVTAPAALAYLKDHPKLSKQDREGLQAGKTVELAISAIASNDKLFLPELKKVCESLGGSKASPGPAKALKEADVFARLYVGMETGQALQSSADSPVASPLATTFPGVPPESAKPVEEKIHVDTKRPRWHSTGLYARPGSIIEVTVPPKAVNKKISIRIGCHTDVLWSKDEWKRAPEIARSFLITAPSTKATSGFGGLIYIDVPKECAVGEFEAKISGGIPAPRFVRGKTTNTEWKTIRARPGPWAEIGSDKLIITIQSEAIRDYEDPEGLMEYWDRVLDACADLATISTERSSPERIVLDAQISAGYLHAGYPIMGPISTTRELLDLKTLSTKGNWGYYHELGHNHQRPEWTWDGLGEVTVNLFSMYLLDTLNPGAPHHEAIQPDHLQKMIREFEQKGKLDGPFPQLMPYIQLYRAVGWQPYMKVFAEYRDLPDNQKPKTLQEKKDQWLVRMSKATNKNLGPFYEYWKFGASEEAMKSVRDLPEWKFEPLK